MSPRPIDRSADVLVVGGGPAGLATALLAARTGRSVMVIEASSRLGGMAASPTVAGQRVDLGSHRLHPSASPPTRALLDELLGSDLQHRPRHGRLHLDGRWVGFPLQLGDLMRSLPPTTAMRIGADLASGMARRESPEDTYADVIAARLGPTVLDRFHGPYAAKLWGIGPEHLAGELARRRVALRGVGDVLRRLRRSTTPEGRTFLYPRLGYGQIIDRLAEAAIDAGVTILTDTKPLAVDPDPTAPVVHTDEGARLAGGRIFWTAPPSALLAATTTAGDVRPALRHRGVALVYLALDRPQFLEWDAHYVPDLDVPFVRLSEPKNYRDGPDPADRTVLCAEVPCSPGDPVWQAADDELEGTVLEGIDRLGLPVPTPVEVQVIRLPQVYPFYDNAGAVRLAQMRSIAEAVDGVTVLGRQGLGVADNLHHVLDMARWAVSALTDDGWDETAWRRARARIDAHVVED